MLEWDITKETLVVDHLDIADSEYHKFAVHLDKYKHTRFDDKVSVEAMGNLFIDYNILKSMAKGLGLCRRLNSNPTCAHEISIGDFLYAGMHNKKYDGDLVRRLIRRMNEHDIGSDIATAEESSYTLTSTSSSTSC